MTNFIWPVIQLIWLRVLLAPPRGLLCAWQTINLHWAKPLLVRSSRSLIPLIHNNVGQGWHLSYSTRVWRRWLEMWFSIAYFPHHIRALICLPWSLRAAFIDIPLYMPLLMRDGFGKPSRLNIRINRAACSGWLTAVYTFVKAKFRQWRGKDV